MEAVKALKCFVKLEGDFSERDPRRFGGGLVLPGDEVVETSTKLARVKDLVDFVWREIRVREANGRRRSGLATG